MAKAPTSKATEGGIIESVDGNVANVSFVGQQPARRDILVTEDGGAQLEVYGSVSQNTVACFVLTPQSELARGMRVTNTEESLQIPVGKRVLGRAIDIFGQPHDEKGKLEKGASQSLYHPIKPDLADVVSPHEVVETGIRVFDFFTPSLRGGRTGLVGGAGVGKTVILAQLVKRIALKNKEKNPGVVVFSAVGERSREAHELHSDLVESGIMPYSSLVLGQMGENPVIRFRTAYAGATLAEYWRDEEHKDVLFFMDNMYRFTQAGHELATVMNTIPSEDGYQATLTSEMADLNERLLSTKQASVTSFIAIFVPADDFTDYGTRSAFSYLDTTIMLSREIFQSGRYPAVDILGSASAAINPTIIGTEHYLAYIQAKQILERAAELERIVSLVGTGELSGTNQETYTMSQQITNYMTQDLFLTEDETGHPSVYEPRANTIAVIKDILDGQFSDVDPEKFRFIVDGQKLKSAPVENVTSPAQ
ncbi:F0F1 ATP synthase subunit beta [bacterium]|nr:F0F1 ATP synthase subunit beta [bacterium]